MDRGVASDIKTLGSVEYYRCRLRQKIKTLRSRAKESSSKTELDQLRLYFMNRAIEVGEGCHRVRDLGLPLFALSRVLCEDFILLFWVTRSEQNAAEYIKWASSEATRMLRVWLTEGRGRIRQKSTGKDVTKEFLPKLDEFIMSKKSLADIATKSGLSKAYDMYYRPHSLEAHAKTIGIPFSESGDMAAAALCSINGILKVITLVVDKPPEKITAQEILRHLGIENLGGG
jgi:hypothetical protein